MSLHSNVDRIGRSEVLGWAYDPAQPEEPVWIAVHVDAREAGRVRADRPRNGLAAPCEFRFAFDPPLSVFTPHLVEVRSAADGALLRGGARRLDAPLALSPGSRTPILLTSTGRSGSTVLMRELARHPDIVVADRHPYEVKQIAYHAAALRALAAEADRERGSHPERMLGPAEAHRVGSNPYNSRGLDDLAEPPARLQEHFERLVPQRLAAQFADIIAAYYDVLAASQGKLAAPYFAEKGDVERAARQAARLFFGRVREIVVLRDPRDLLCSAVAFWKLPLEQTLTMLQTTLPQLEAIRQEAAEDTLFVRYEDLMREPVATRRRISDFLGLDLAAIPADADSTEMTRHRTSADPAASVERWRQDLDPQWIAACDTSFARYMAAFDYAAADSGQVAAAMERLRRNPLVAEGEHAVSGFLANRARSTHQGEPLAPVLDATFGQGGNGMPLLGAGWSRPDRGSVWNDGHRCTLRLPGLAAGARYRLRLLIAPYLHPERLPAQRVRVECAGVTLAEATLRDLAILAVDLPDAATGTHLPVSLTLHLPDAARPADLAGGEDRRLLGVSLRRAILLERLASETDAPHPLPPEAASRSGGAFEALALRFESLGENCEFGLVQRRLGAEPLGLLRFAAAPLPRLLRALRKRFSGIGRPEFVDVRPSANGREYMVVDRRFGFEYHAWVLVGEGEPEQVRAREIKRLPLLARKLIEDLEEGSKLFVYHGLAPLPEAEVRELADAIAGYGPATLLWVEVADAANPPGSVVRLGDNLLKAHITRFAPGEDAHDFQLDDWIDLCRAALAAVGAPPRPLLDEPPVADDEGLAGQRVGGEAGEV